MYVKKYRKFLPSNVPIFDSKNYLKERKAYLVRQRLITFGKPIRRYFITRRRRGRLFRFSCRRYSIITRKARRMVLPSFKVFPHQGRHRVYLMYVPPPINYRKRYYYHKGDMVPALSFAEMMTDKVKYFGTKPRFPWMHKVSRKLGSKYPKLRKFPYVRRTVRYIKFIIENFKWQQWLPRRIYRRKLRYKRIWRGMMTGRRVKAGRLFMIYVTRRRAGSRFFKDSIRVSGKPSGKLFVRESFFKRLFFQFYMFMVRPRSWWFRRFYLRLADIKRWFVPKQWMMLGRIWFLRHAKRARWLKHCVKSGYLTDHLLFLKSMFSGWKRRKYAYWSRVKLRLLKWRWGVKRAWYRKNRFRKRCFFGISVTKTENNYFFSFYRILKEKRRFIFNVTAGKAKLHGRNKLSVPGIEIMIKLFCKRVRLYLIRTRLLRRALFRLIIGIKPSYRVKVILREMGASRLKCRSIYFKKVRAHNGCRKAKARRK